MKGVGETRMPGPGRYMLRVTRRRAPPAGTVTPPATTNRPESEGTGTVIAMRRVRLLGSVSRPMYRASVHNWSRYTGKHTGNLKHNLCLSESGCTRTRPTSRVCPARGWSDQDGHARERRARPAADRRAGPFRPERTRPVLPGPSLASIRDSFHYGKNELYCTQPPPRGGDQAVKHLEPCATMIS